MIDIGFFNEDYGKNKIEFDDLKFSDAVERSVSTGSWGTALSLSIEETLSYSRKKKNSFIPSAGLLFSTFKNLSNKNSLTNQENKFLKEMNDYWHRTASILVFPTKSKKGYVVHYPNLGNNSLERYKDGSLSGKIKIELHEKEFPPYGDIARISEYPDFFVKVLGTDCLKSYSEFKKKLGMDVCMWIPPKNCIIGAPEKLIILGAFGQYGMGLWLTSYTSDKALVGSRPFRLAYNYRGK